MLAGNCPSAGKKVTNLPRAPVNPVRYTPPRPRFSPWWMTRTTGRSRASRSASSPVPSVLPSSMISTSCGTPSRSSPASWARTTGRSVAASSQAKTQQVMVGAECGSPGSLMADASPLEHPPDRRAGRPALQAGGGGGGGPGGPPGGERAGGGGGVDPVAPPGDEAAGVERDAEDPGGARNGVVGGAAREVPDVARHAARARVHHRQRPRRRDEGPVGVAHQRHVEGQVK